MSQYWIEPLTDAGDNKYWMLFRHGMFHEPTAVIDDVTMNSIAKQVLPSSADVNDITEVRELMFQLAGDIALALVGEPAHPSCGCDEAGHCEFHRTLSTIRACIKVLEGE